MKGTTMTTVMMRIKGMLSGRYSNVLSVLH